MTFNSLFQDRMQEERKRLGLTQAEAAARCDVSREVWGRYERGVAVPGGEVLAAFAHLGADAQYILAGQRGTHASMTHGATVDPERLALIAEMLEGVAKKAGRRWPTKRLIAVAAEVYNTLDQDRELDEPQVERILKLVVNR
ncbi:helix-turn-helix domain-containing protein [Pseudomonas nicosulfuronedens]